MAHKWGLLCPIFQFFFGGGGELGSRLTQCGLAEAYTSVKWHLDPYTRFATIHQRYRQTDRHDRQRFDSVGRTVLQTVVRKRFAVFAQLDITAKSPYILQTAPLSQKIVASGGGSGSHVTNGFLGLPESSAQTAS